MWSENMDKPIKKIIAALATIIILIMMYLGAYLPLRKGQLYAQSVLKLNSRKIKSVTDFIAAFHPALSFYSPIGQEEVVSYYTGEVLSGMLKKQKSPRVIEILIKDAENWMEPIIKVGKGFSYSQNLYNFGKVYKIAGEKLNNDTYLEKGIALFNEGLKNSPNRYIFLDGLFDIYQIRGDKVKMKEIGETILKYWPDKQEIRKSIL